MAEAEEITPFSSHLDELRKRLIEETLPIKRELYISLTVDRETERVALVASSEGGMEIEEVAEKSPEKILKEFCDPLLGLQDFQCRALAFGR